MEKKKFCKIDQYLRIGLGLELENSQLSEVTEDSVGIAELRPVFNKETTKVYLDLQGAGSYPEQFQVVVPEALRAALWGEILLNNRPGALLNFGRRGEDLPFGFEDKYYIPLRLYPQEKAPADWQFNPIYVRVDKGADVYFFVIYVQWEDNLITVEVNHKPKPKDIPYFLR